MRLTSHRIGIACLVLAAALGVLSIFVWGDL